MAPRPAVESPHALPASEVLARLGADAHRGLTSAEALARLAQYGRNELPAAPPVPRWRRFLAQLQSPLVLLLLAAAAVSLGVWWYEGGGHAPYEALAILAIVVANAALGFMQEERAERALASLKRMTAATALVVRDGERASVPAAEIVPGDLLAIEEGATIPADARVLQSVSLQTAEGALTGESTPVEKHADADRRRRLAARPREHGVLRHDGDLGPRSRRRHRDRCPRGDRAHRRAARRHREPADAASAPARQSRQGPRRGRHRDRGRRRRDDPRAGAGLHRRRARRASCSTPSRSRSPRCRKGSPR